MMNYENIFEFNKHFLTRKSDYSTRRYLLENQSQLDNILLYQKNNEDVFITKYPTDRLIKTIILDFDSKDKSEAYYEVLKLYNYLDYHNVKSIIVDSTNKGYHIYIFIPPMDFGAIDEEFNERDNNNLFNEFVKQLINFYEFDYKTLDITNTHAGLGGNIRLIGSLHPKTQQKLKIIKGDFVYDNKDYYNDCLDFINDKYEQAEAYYRLQKIDEYNRNKIMFKNLGNYDGEDIIEKNDLRIIMPNLFGGKVNNHGDYIFMQCPYHNDHNPSMLVTKYYFSCASCNTKGNIWKLIKDGTIKYDDYK